MSKITTAVSNIMKDVGSVKKEGTNKFHDYKYAQASDVLHKIQPLLAREGLVIFQSEVERVMLGDGGALAITYEFNLAHVEGETWPDRPRKTGMAAARNSKGGFDDKAANKCGTAARKYFLLELFQIPTGDYDDADDQEDTPPARSAPIASPPVAPAKTEPPVDPETGECGPHKIVKTDDMNSVQWGALFIAAVKTAKSEADIDQWVLDNSEALGLMRDSAPKAHKSVMGAIKDKRESFKEKVS